MIAFWIPEEEVLIPPSVGKNKFSFKTHSKHWGELTNFDRLSVKNS